MEMLLIKLESPAIFGSVSTLVAYIDKPGEVGEIQKIHLRAKFTLYRKAPMTTIFAKMMPYIQLDELRQDEKTPLLRCVRSRFQLPQWGMLLCSPQMA